MSAIVPDLSEQGQGQATPLALPNMDSGSHEQPNLMMTRPRPAIMLDDLFANRALQHEPEQSEHEDGSNQGHPNIAEHESFPSVHRP